MEKEKKRGIGKFFLIGIVLMLILIGGVSAYQRSNPSYTSFSSGFGSYGGSSLSFNSEMCNAAEGSDFLVQVAPFGCEPATVRSDLLEEQNVPVFCQLAATKINPLIDVEAIESLSFSGEYPREIASIGFQPARAALGVQGNLNSPTILENIGYAVIVLRKQANSSAMPENVTGTIKAKLNYDVKNAFGIGTSSFYLPAMTDEEWEENKNAYSFWGGKGYLRLNSLIGDRASVTLYDGTGNVVDTVELEKGKSSNRLTLPGFSCLASLNLRLNNLEDPRTVVSLDVGEDTLELAKGETFLDGKCRVLNIKKDGLVQKVSLQCREDTENGYAQTKAFELTINPQIVFDLVGEGAKSYEVGDIISSSGGKSFFVGYLGLRKLDNKLFMIPVISEAKDKESFLRSTDYLAAQKIGKVVENLRGYESDIKDNTEVKSAMKNAPKAEFMRPYYVGDSEGFVSLKDGMGFFKSSLTFKGFIGAKDQILDGNLEVVQEYYEKANQDYDTVINTYPSEAGLASDDNKDAKQEALEGKIKLASGLKQQNALLTLCEEYRANYPDIPELTECKSSYVIASSDVSSVFVYTNGRSTRISFAGIKEPTFEEYGALINVIGTGKLENDGNKKLTVGERFYLSTNESTSQDYEEFFEIKEIRDDSVILYAEYVQEVDGKTSLKRDSQLKLTQDGFIRFGVRNYELRLSQINIKKSAKVSVVPSINNAGSNVEFDFNIGIEGRSIELSPGKTKALIKKMNKSIEEFQEKSDKLNKTVKNLKTACVVAGMALTVKNFFTNLDGEGTARSSVMNGKGGWKEKCAQYAAAGKGPDPKGQGGEVSISSKQDCYNTYSSLIEEQVDTYARNLEREVDQTKLDEEKAGITKGGVFEEDIVNSTEYVRIKSERLKNEYGGLGPITTSDGKTINRVDVYENINADAWQNQRTFTKTQLEDIALYERILADDNADERSKQSAKDNLYSIYNGIGQASGAYNKQKEFASEIAGLSASDIGFFTTQGVKNKITYTGKTAGDLGSAFSSLDKDTPMQAMMDSTGTKYFVPLSGNAGLSQLASQRDPTNSSNFVVYKSDGTRLSQNEIPQELKNSYFVRVDEQSLTGNKITNPEIRYYETEPYKGLPAIVPFDVDNGWYAATRQTLPVGNNMPTFDKSGRVSSFYLCNVGTNKLIQFNSGVGDDHCELINLGTGQTYSQFGGLSEKKTADLVKKAVQAIEDASNAYKQGVTDAKIFGHLLKVGNPATGTPEVECQDTMSATECQVLFNLCDPVVCPNSRCNLGGEYNVQDVVQSGILGSLLLCLPNIKEGIFIPICLSGLKAGIDNYISVLTAYRDCLQTKLDTGQQVGVCDQVYSLHLCNLFWETAQPFAENLLPKLIGGLTGSGGSRGGGEYMNVQSAWDTASKSADFFTGYYGANAFEAFKVSSFEQVGSLFCKSQISGVYPDSADLFNQLVEPESPPQYTASFEEIPFTSTTNPPTSQYKVFYHIYGGTGEGTYYSVYLKGGSGSSFYQDTSGTRSVAQGFIAPGEYASATPDFTAPAGYKELCVVINGQEECGFGEVSTSFTLDYISDLHAADQAGERNIRSEADCVSGTASAYSLLSLNPEQAVRELVDPAIYNQGIIRTCATNNPGQSTDRNLGTANARWVEVGNCGEERIKCWLDTDSVKEAIEGLGIERDTLEQQSSATLQTLSEENKYEADIEGKIKEIKDKWNLAVRSKSDLPRQEVFDLVATTLNRVIYNSDRVTLLLLRAEFYSQFATKQFSQIKAEEAKPEPTLPASEVDAGGPEEYQQSLAQKEDEGLYGELGTETLAAQLAAQDEEEREQLSKQYLYPELFYADISDAEGFTTNYEFVLSLESDETMVVYSVVVGQDIVGISLDPEGNGGIGGTPSAFANSMQTIFTEYKEAKAELEAGYYEESLEGAEDLTGRVIVKQNILASTFAGPADVFNGYTQTNLYFKNNNGRLELRSSQPTDILVGIYNPTSKIITLSGNAAARIDDELGNGAYEQINGKALLDAFEIIIPSTGLA